jgi:hypothetical protein
LGIPTLLPHYYLCFVNEIKIKGGVLSFKGAPPLLFSTKIIFTGEEAAKKHRLFY